MCDKNAKEEKQCVTKTLRRKSKTHMTTFERGLLKRTPLDNHHLEMQAQSQYSAFQQDKACSQQTSRPRRRTNPICTLR